MAVAENRREPIKRRGNRFAGSNDFRVTMKEHHVQRCDTAEAVEELEPPRERPRDALNALRDDRGLTQPVFIGASAAGLNLQVK
jgi:hypothetical protein